MWGATHAEFQSGGYSRKAGAGSYSRHANAMHVTPLREDGSFERYVNMQMHIADFYKITIPFQRTITQSPSRTDDRPTNPPPTFLHIQLSGRATSRSSPSGRRLLRYRCLRSQRGQAPMVRWVPKYNLAGLFWDSFLRSGLPRRPGKAFKRWRASPPPNKKTNMVEGLGGPGSPKTVHKCEELRPPPFGRGFRAPGAVHPPQ